jgi:MFS superfamily sulfate permease-like transporter
MIVRLACQAGIEQQQFFRQALYAIHHHVVLLPPDTRDVIVRKRVHAHAEGRDAKLGNFFHGLLGVEAQVLRITHIYIGRLAIGALAIVVVAPRLTRRIPSLLIATVAVTAVQACFQFDGVATTGRTVGGIPSGLPEFSLLLISFVRVLERSGPAFTMALPGAIELLLCAVVADGMAGTRHGPNQELVGQGIANIASLLFGRFAATDAIARTATNLRNSGDSPLAITVMCRPCLPSSLPLHRRQRTFHWPRCCS